jgi:peptidoglycan LD-endopeptidase CwlK
MEVYMAAKYSNKSKQILDGCHEDLQRLFNEVIKHVDCSIISGYREKDIQNSLYRSGKSKLKYPDSKHNFVPSNAVDATPYPIDWNDKERLYYFVGYVLGIASQMKIKIRSGADWNMNNNLRDQTFFDLCHFERN